MNDMKFNNEEAFQFCTQMSMILSSGLSIQEGLEIIAADANNQKMKKVCGELYKAMKDTGALYKALQQASYVDDYMKHMVEIGEVSGHLDSVMEELAGYYERANDLKDQLKEALLYPFVLLIMMWTVVGIIVWKVLPIFSQVLHNMGSPLPENALMIMNFGKLFALISFIVLTIILLATLFILIHLRYGKNKASTFLSHFFLTKKLYHNITMAKMTYALSLFISGGYDMEEALSYIPSIVEEANIQRRLQACITAVKNNEAFEKVLQKEHLYDGAYANMIVTGFRSGRSDEVMKKIADLYEKDVDNGIRTFLNTIEPLIVIFLSLIVGVILLSVMLPLMSIMSSLG